MFGVSALASALDSVTIWWWLLPAEVERVVPDRKTASGSLKPLYNCAMSRLSRLSARAWVQLDDKIASAFSNWDISGFDSSVVCSVRRRKQWRVEFTPALRFCTNAEIKLSLRSKRVVVCWALGWAQEKTGFEALLCFCLVLKSTLNQVYKGINAPKRDFQEW